MRKMSLDLGDRRIGIALSDPLGIIASGYETYIRDSDDEAVKYVLNLAKVKEVNTIVIGLPINMDGTHGERVEKSKEFGNRLIALDPNISIAYIDERLTTVSAERMLIDANMRRDKRKAVIDKVAATIILQTYLDSKR